MNVTKMSLIKEHTKSSSVRNRCIILLELTWSRDKDPRIPLGHSSILATLQKNSNVAVKSVVFPVNKDSFLLPKLISQITNESVNWEPEKIDLAIGVYVWGEEILQELLPSLREVGFKGRIILGGPQISYADGGLEKIYPDADVFVRGYAENAMSILANTHKQKPISGVHYAGTPDLFTQSEVDLEKLASPWLLGTIPIKGQKFIRWETQRGCPYKCAFCQHREAGSKLQRKTLNDSRIFREIAFFCENDVKEIAVLDPIFNVGSRATKILQRFIEKEFTGHISLQCRAEITKPEFLEAASKLNTTLEFGLQTIHDEEGGAIQRRNKMAKVSSVIEELNQRGIHYEISLIFGLPEQTLDSFIESVVWCLKRNVPIVKAFPLMLLRGTKLEQERKKWNLKERGLSMPVVVSSDTFSEEEWLCMASISEALKATEGGHPKDIDELLKIAKQLQPRLKRWQPLPEV